SPTDTIRVDVIYDSGTATPGSDFAFSDTSLIFPPLDTVNQLVSITIVDDNVAFESPETIVLILQNPTNGAVLGNSIHTVTIIDNDTITGIPQYSMIKNKIIVYPNPANDLIHITFSNSEFSPYTLNIYNVTGQLKVSKIITSDAVIDISDLQSGLYLLNIYNDRDRLTKQVSIIK
ncbi:MAG: T9SS type A sorting domain-containing protein, partial [Bacteroidetes bacterium]|nr:T9SS type A sorting domain-containing protein [Bacteroidota bacterium]